MHTDKFGRKWRFTPGHDADKMLRPSDEHALAALNFQKTLRKQLLWSEREMRELECYLLKMGNRWVFGARFGDEGGHYYSPGLDDGIIQTLLREHTANSAAEQAAIDALKDWE